MRFRAPVLISLALLLPSGCHQSSDPANAAPQQPSRAQPDTQASPTAPSAGEAAGVVLPAGARRVELVYRAVVTVPKGEGPVDVFIPIAQSDDHQSIESVKVESRAKGSFQTEPKYGNRYWHARQPESDGEPLEVTARYRAVRRPFQRDDLEHANASLTPAEQRKYAQFLSANERVPVDDPVLAPALADIRKTAKSTASPELARAIYDWVIDNMEYKKVGTGWGNGDTYWACSEKYGNCTDFHSLFISLARSVGIPARFEIGFPIPQGQPHGTIQGYHCWVQLYLSGVGWVPVDASDAKKHPEKRDLLFGAQPPDRIRFTTGRDLELGPQQHSIKLNYFIYPHVEVNGKALESGIEKAFSYRELRP